MADKMTTSPKPPNLIIQRPATIPAAVLDAASKWVQTRQSTLFTWLSTTKAGVDFNRVFIDQLYRTRKEYESIGRLDVLLDHSGGSGEAAYQLLNFLRAHCKELHIFVPDWAKSAATLFALGADVIWMSELAEIGPLDAQIPDPRDPDAPISALDEFRAVDYLRTHSFEILDEFKRMLGRTTSLSTSDKLKFSIDYTTRLLKPVYSNVETLHFGGSHRAVESSAEYGKRVMSRYAYRDWSATRVTALVKKLTWDYPSHSFVIDIREARELGLKVKLLDGELEDLAETIVSGLTDAAGILARYEEPAKSSVNVAAPGDRDGQEANPNAAR